MAGGTSAFVSMRERLRSSSIQRRLIADLHQRSVTQNGPDHSSLPNFKSRSTPAANHAHFPCCRTNTSRKRKPVHAKAPLLASAKLGLSSNCGRSLPTIIRKSRDSSLRNSAAWRFIQARINWFSSASIVAEMSDTVQARSAATPGNSLPSIHSRKAPPAVET